MSVPAVLLLFLFPSTVSAERCCLVEIETTSQSVLTGEGVSVGNPQQSCAPITDSNPCSPASELVPDQANGTAYDSMPIYYTQTTRTEVSCDRYPALCQPEKIIDSKSCTEIMAGTGSLQDRISDCRSSSNCFYAGDQCLSRYDSSICTILPQSLCGTPEGAKPNFCSWNADTNRCLPAVENALGSQYGKSADGALLPTCAIQGNCRNFNDIIIVFIRMIRYVFGILGSLAFAAFIYGGLMMIISFGNSDRIDKGKSALVAAIIGLAIAFSAYVLIGYVLDVFELSSDLRIIGSGS